MVAPRTVLPKTSLPKAALAKRAAPSYSLPKEKRMTRGRWAALISVLLIVGLGAAWLMGLFGPDPRLAELSDLRAKADDKSLSDKDRRALFDEMRKKWQELPEDVRQKAMQNAGPPRMMNRGPKVSEVLAMPVDKRNAALDKQIDDMLKRQKEMEQRQAEMAKNGQGQAGGPPGVFQQPNQGQMNQWRNRMLSSVPADSRASFGIYRQLMQARAEQRGITLPFGPGR
jgi:hypothetical protein